MDGSHLIALEDGRITESVAIAAGIRRGVFDLESSLAVFREEGRLSLRHRYQGGHRLSEKV